MDIMTQAPENRTFNDKFMLRLPDGMRDRIKAAAEANNRSMNAEIVARIEGSFVAGVAGKQDADRINENLIYLIKKMTEFEIRLEAMTAGKPDPWPGGRKEGSP